MNYRDKNEIFATNTKHFRDKTGENQKENELKRGKYPKIRIFQIKQLSGSRPNQLRVKFSSPKLSLPHCFSVLKFQRENKIFKINEINFRDKTTKIRK